MHRFLLQTPSSRSHQDRTEPFERQEFEPMLLVLQVSGGIAQSLWKEMWRASKDRSGYERLVLQAVVGQYPVRYRFPPIDPHIDAWAVLGLQASPQEAWEWAWPRNWADPKEEAGHRLYRETGCSMMNPNTDADGE
jgi:hypothetical protein